MLELLRNKRILVVAAHPDDELLGLGGTVNRFSRSSVIRAVILGEGITSRSAKRNTVIHREDLMEHSSDTTRACSRVGYSSFHCYDFPDNRFDGVDLLEIVKVIEDEIEKFNPDFVLTHHNGDVNIDHKCTYEAVIPAIRPLPGKKRIGLITFETPSSTEYQSPDYHSTFKPNLFVKLSAQNIEAKIQGMECYRFEKRPYPHPRSPQALSIIAQRWGLYIGEEFAEAFRVEKLYL
jgi:LmbE family N-acetylglucosaminyl deacetylase